MVPKMYILLSVERLMGCFLSLFLSHCLCLSIFSLLCFLFLPLLFFFFSPSLCLCVLCFSVSQADDDSSQTSPDYTVRPNIKIHNLGEWLDICLCIAGNEQQPIARCWPIFGCGYKAWFVHQPLWNGTKLFFSFFILCLAKENPQAIAGWWVEPLFSALESCAIGGRP